MDNITIEKTEATPGVEFDFAKNRFVIFGESYPEDSIDFFAGCMTRLRDHLAIQRNSTIDFEFHLIYFNSATAKVIYDLIIDLDKAAESGNVVHIDWHCREQDEHMKEVGEDFSEGVRHAEFRVKSS